MGILAAPDRVEPGLYAVGRPGTGSPVLVTANYRLSFDIVRKELGRCEGWILALDTGGMNVSCGVATGRFGTDELITRVQKSRLQEVVQHRTLILPPLGAPGVSGEEVLRHTGFDVRFGPVRAADIPAYLARGWSTTPEMRVVRLTVRDRLALTPSQIVQSLRVFPAFAFAALIVAGLGPDGVSLGRAWTGSWPLFGLGLGSICAGSFLAPLLLPFIPLPAFSAKGWVVGVLVSVVLLHGAGLASGMDHYFLAACYLFFPAASAALALRFARALPSAYLTNVRRDLRLSLPFFIAAGLLSLAALALSKRGL
jgi:acetyl-CoA decarbonylase/synthase complex subunit gamma